MIASSTFEMACPQCGTVQWVTAGESDRCIKCSAPIATAVAQAATGTGMPNMQMPNVTNMVSGAMVGKLIASGGKVKTRTIMIGVVGMVIAIVIVSMVVMSLKKKLGLSTPKGYLAYPALGIDPAHGDPDQMIAATREPARRWAKDAAFWAINIRHLRADGTVNLNDAAAVITYISPSRVTSYLKTERKDAVKDFSFSSAGVGWAAVKGVLQRWDNPQPVQLGACTIKKLTETLRASYGFTGDKIVSVGFDPSGLRTFYDRDGWNVDSEDHAIKGVFAMDDCSVLKPH